VEETFINEIKVNDSVGAMAKVLIATLYSAEPVLLAATRLSAERLILLVDDKPDAEQEKSLKTIQGSLGKIMDVKVVKTPVYDIVKVAEKCVEIIDQVPREDTIYVNVTSGRKTKALGLLFAAYARCTKVKKIAYNPEEDKTSVVYLPKLSFNLSDSQKRILVYLAEDDYKNHELLAKKLDMSRAMLYRNITELQKLDFITVENGLHLTDAGRIARL
jgi:CRISPR locus-related DNA-binding protein